MAISHKNDLLQLGFTANDADVYQALIKCGPCPAGPLISETGFHRNIVYTSLEHLAARKLVAEERWRGRAKFSITSPERLAEEYAQKSRLALTVAKELQAQMKLSPQEITVHEGNEEYLSLLISLLRSLPRGSTKYVLGTGGETFMRATMIPIWEKYHQIAKAQGIQIKMIGYGKQKAQIEPWTKSAGMYEARYLASELENPSGIHIYPEADTVLNIIYSDDRRPVTAIKIRNAALVQGYLHMFRSLWKMGRG